MPRQWLERTISGSTVGGDQTNGQKASLPQRHILPMLLGRERLDCASAHIYPRKALSRFTAPDVVSSARMLVTPLPAAVRVHEIRSMSAALKNHYLLKDTVLGPRNVIPLGAVYDKLRKELRHRWTPQYPSPHLLNQVPPLDSHSNQKQQPS